MGENKKKPRSQKDHYPPPPLPWQADPQNYQKPDFGSNYKEYYDKQAGVEKEIEKPDLPKSVPGQVADMVKKHMETVKAKLNERDEKVKRELK